MTHVVHGKTEECEYIYIYIHILFIERKGNHH